MSRNGFYDDMHGHWLYTQEEVDYMLHEIRGQAKIGFQAGASAFNPVVVHSWTNGTLDSVTTRYYYDLIHPDLPTYCPVITLYSISLNQNIPVLACVPNGTTTIEKTTQKRIWLEADPGADDIILRYS